MKNEAERFLEGMQWLGSRLAEHEPRTSWLRKKVFRCIEARDAAHDPEFKALWENHAEVLRALLRKELN